MAAVSADEVKARARTTWALGDYQKIADRQQSIAEALCDWVEVSAGEQVLDIGTATGNVALAAARRGASAVGVDITPQMLELARARAEEHDVRFVEGDAEQLPLPDGSVDVGLSACGMWFAPRPAVAVAELHRVVRPGGRIGLANFTPGGYMGQVNEIIKRWLPLPNGVPEPNDWGVEDIAWRRLADGFDAITCRPGTVRYSFASAPDAVRFLTTYSPPHVAATRTLDPTAAGDLAQAIEDVTATFPTDADGLYVDAEYLLVRANRR